MTEAQQDAVLAELHALFDGTPEGRDTLKWLLLTRLAKDVRAEGLTSSAFVAQHWPKDRA